MNDKIYFGFARRNINPLVLMSLAGYFNVRIWEKILDDIEVRVLALHQGEKFTAIIQFDLVTVTQNMADAFFSEIADIKKFNSNNVIITATHSHTAPEIRASKGGFNAQYISFIIKQAAEALREALDDLQVGAVVYGKTRDSRFAFNRRYWMKDAAVVTNPGKLNPEINSPEGEVDYDIPLLGIKKEGKLHVLIANIVNHTDSIGGCDVSADWPGFMIKRIKAEIGENTMVLPLIGCAGNINHFDVSTDMNQTCYAEAERIGNGYADTIIEALSSLEKMSDCILKLRSCKVICSSREISEKELFEARAAMEKYKNVSLPANGENMTSEDLARKTPKVLKYFADALIKIASDETDRVFNLTLISIGSVCIVSLPCEPFVEIGIEIKNKILPDKLAMVVSHSNGTGAKNVGGGYIPNEWNYERGGYETTPRSSPFSIKTARKLIEAVESLRNEMRRDFRTASCQKIGF